MLLRAVAVLVIVLALSIALLVAAIVFGPVDHQAVALQALQAITDPVKHLLDNVSL